MPANANVPRRRSPRMKDCDYSQPGTYFVTICTHRRRNLFGQVVDGTMQLNVAGAIAQKVWEGLPKRFPVLLDAWVIMPNHMHGSLIITDSTPPYRLHGNSLLGEIVRAFKAATSRQVRRSGMTTFRWQRIYWEGVVRSERQYRTLQNYIANNPARWSLDRLYAKGADGHPSKQPG